MPALAGSLDRRGSFGDLVRLRLLVEKVHHRVPALVTQCLERGAERPFPMRRVCRGSAVGDRIFHQVEVASPEDTEHYALTRDFLQNRERYLRRLLGNDEQ